MNSVNSINSFAITDEMKKYISLQRTGITNNHAEEYYRHIEFQWNIMKKYIDGRTSVLDIGCGLAGIDYFIGKENEKSKLYLLDKTEVSPKIYYGYKSEAAYYNSMDLAVDFLRMNGIKNIIETLSPEQYITYAKEFRFDAIISLISCGFHYPVAIYIDAICDSLKECGVVILDIRHGAIKESIKIFKDRGFKNKRLHIFEKCDKMMFESI